MFAGAALNYTPDQLRKVFDPNKGFVFDTTNRFDLGALAPGSTANTGADRQNLPDISKYGELGQAVVLSNYYKPSQAEEMKNMIPILKEMGIFQADLADKNAQRKFGQEMLAAGLGSLQKGIQTSIAGGSPEMLAYLADAPIRNADAYLSARRGQPRQEIPVFAPQPLPNRQYYA